MRVEASFRIGHDHNFPSRAIGLLRGGLMNSQRVLIRSKFEHKSEVPLWKRALDLSMISLLAPGWLLVGAGVALVIKCGSRGPIFFRQRRVGHKGQEFT